MFAHRLFVKNVLYAQLLTEMRSIANNGGSD
jgi:hypothetical protein